VKQGIEFECIPTDPDIRAICDFDWTAKSVGNSTVHFKINFKRPLEVSQDRSRLDSLILKIWNIEPFLDSKSAQHTADTWEWPGVPKPIRGLPPLKFLGGRNLQTSGQKPPVYRIDFPTVEVGSEYVEPAVIAAKVAIQASAGLSFTPKQVTNFLLKNSKKMFF